MDKGKLLHLGTGKIDFFCTGRNYNLDFLKSTLFDESIICGISI